MDANGAVQTMLAQAWDALGGDADLVGRVRVERLADDLLPSTLHSLPAMVAAIGASTLAAAALDAARTGTQVAPVTIDAEHASIAAVSERHARRDGAGVPDMFAPLSRFWPTADGWLRTHANYPWHRARLIAVLGCNDPGGGGEDALAAALGEAIAGRNGSDLEDALAAGGALGYAVRPLDEWRIHPQGAVVAARPLLQVRPLGDAPPQNPGRPSEDHRFCQGVRVLDLTRVIAGPVGTRTLAAWGAEVLRLDPPMWPEIPAQAVDTLSGKRSADLDISSGAGRERLEGLLDQADVVVHGYRPGALARHGLDADDLARRHPHLSVVQLSAWGPTGPWADRRGFDSLVQCPTGVADAERTALGPGALPAQVLDHATGYLSAAAALLALARTAGGGPPSFTTLTLANTAHWLTSAGTTERGRQRRVDPTPYEVRLSGPTASVTVVAPPGRVGDHRPHWTSTTDLKADRPSF